jgi:predicted phosphodiesterase
MKHRILLVSDMHYSTEETHAEMKKIDPTVNASAAAGDAFGYTQREKIEKIYEAVVSEHKKAPLDAVLVLGDLSIDDYSFRNLPVNYCKKFKEDCMDRLPCPSYAIPGNHDSYPDEIWEETFGYGRQFTVEIGDAVFLMMDTFHSTPACSASGSPCTPLDADFLRFSLNRYKGRRIFICAHHIAENVFTEETKELIRSSEDVVCLFRGHVHRNAVIDLGEALGHKTLIDIGGYAYNGKCIDKRWTFSLFDFAWAWGYQILEWDDEAVHTYHIKPTMHYKAENGVFDVSETRSGELYF